MTTVTHSSQTGRGSFWMTSWELLRDTLNEWLNDRAPRLGAALAYYSVFSIAPLLLIAIAIAGALFSREAAEQRVVTEIEGTVGKPMAQAVQQMLVSSADADGNTGAAIIGAVVLLIGAMGVFGELQDALNTVWKVTPKPGRGLMGIVQDRLLSLTMVLGSGFLLLVSLIASAVLAALGRTLGEVLPGGAVFWNVVNVVVSFVIITLLFALIYKYLPDAMIAWKDVWIGATLTAVLFTVGKALLGWYLGRASTTSAFGAAGSVVVVLLWVYYASQILLFGAEFTRVYATRFGTEIKPAPNAQLVQCPPEAQNRDPQAETQGRPRAST